MLALLQRRRPPRAPPRVQGWNVAAVYCLDAQFASDAAKYIAGMLQALSAMVQLEVPHINVLTKVDLLSAESKVGRAPWWCRAPTPRLPSWLLRTESH